MSPRARRRLAWTGAIAATAVAILGLSAWRAVADGQRATALSVLSTLKADVLLTPDRFAALSPRGADFGVDSDHDVFLATDQGPAAFRDLAGRIDRMRTPKPLDSLAVGEDDSLVTVSGGYLGVLDAGVDAGEALPLPAGEMRLAPSGPGALYLFGGSDGDWRLYRFLADGRFDVLARSDAPITGVAEVADGVLVATARHVTRLTAKGPVLMFKAPDDPAFGPITSIAAAPDGLLFVATADHVYAALGGNALSIVNDSGGALRWRDGRLYVVDPTRRLVYSVGPADRSMFRETSR